MKTTSVRPMSLPKDQRAAHNKGDLKGKPKTENESELDEGYPAPVSSPSTRPSKAMEHFKRADTAVSPLVLKYSSVKIE